MMNAEHWKLSREEHISKLLRERDVTAEYRLGGAWLRKRRKLGLPPWYVRIGRMVYYERSALDAFVQSQRVEPSDGEARQ
jgi:hypothetical protein